MKLKSHVFADTQFGWQHEGMVIQHFVAKGHTFNCGVVHGVHREK
jgi:hypothetical protein